jgi:ATP-binding protein involved in chromosome partitioning
MTELSRERLEQALQGWIDPYLGRDLISARAVRELRADGGTAVASVELGYPADGVKARFEREIAEHLQAALGVPAKVSVSWKVTAHGVRPDLRPLAGIKNIIAVASGKGGVGKSTTAVNLALALRAEGARVGVLDADIYGPSQPRMLGLSGRPESRDGKTMEPMQNYGVQVMSIGFLVDDEQPMVWRGPMATQALTQLLTETRWQELDYLVVDMPPGTGDIQLTLSQKVPVTGAVIVTTPQDIALLDARKGLKMFEKVNVPVLGVIENMSTHVCSNCGHEEHIFGAGGGARMASQYEVDLLGELPLDIRIRQEADSGRPTVVAEPDGKLAQAYRDIARRTAARLSLRGEAGGGGAFQFPKISIQDT